MAGISDRLATKNGRFYDVIPDIPYISATNALESINKPALPNWAASEERKMVLDIAIDFFLNPKNNDLPRDKETLVEIIKGILGKEKKSQKLLRDAGNIGTEIHALIEWDNRKKLGLDVAERPKMRDEAEWGFMAYEDIAKELKFEPRFAEMVVYSHTHQYAGTLDIEGYVTIDGKRQEAIVDIKSGKAIYGEAELQVAAYLKAVIEMGVGNPTIGIIIRTPKVISDPEPEMRVVENIDECFEAFLHAMHLRLWQIKQNKK